MSTMKWATLGLAATASGGSVPAFPLDLYRNLKWVHIQVPQGGKCTTDVDLKCDAALLQEPPASDKAARLQREEKMEADVTKLIVSAGEAGATPFGDSVKMIKDLITQEMMPEVLKLHKHDQHSIIALASAVDCTNKVLSKHDDKYEKYLKIYKKKSEKHNECRSTDEKTMWQASELCHTDWAGLKEEKELQCENFQAVTKTMGNQNNNRQVVKKAGSEETRSYVQRMSATICGAPGGGGEGGFGKGGYVDTYIVHKKKCEESTNKFEGRDKECKDKIDAYDKKKLECDEIQELMDEAACQVTTIQVGICKDYHSTWEEQKIKYEQEVHRVRQEEIDRKAEWRGLKRIGCLIDAFMDGKVEMVEIEKCKRLTHDTSLLDIKYPCIHEEFRCYHHVSKLYPYSKQYQAKEFEPLPAFAKGRLGAHDCTTVTQIDLEEVTTTEAQFQEAGDYSHADQGSFKLLNWNEKDTIKCEMVTFSHIFEKAPHVQVNVDHRGYVGSGTHHAMTSWVQEVHNDNFRACVRQTAHTDDKKYINFDGTVHISYIAFDEAPAGTAVGTAEWSGLPKNGKCDWIEFGQSFDSADDVKVIATIFHDPNKGGHAITHWVQQIEANRFRACVRETKQHDGPHMPFNINFVAWSGNEPEGVQAGRQKIASFKQVKCEEVTFSAPFQTGAPSVQTTINHMYNKSPNVMHNAITVWVENVDAYKFRFCLRELAQHDDQHAPVVVDWLARANVDTRADNAQP